jgi:ribonuclease J
MQTQNQTQNEIHERNLHIIPLGGLGEVGRNMTLLKYKGQILIIDMGFKMPGEDMPGIDYIIPDISYLKGKEKDILGVLFTHGHYDHIGAVPYFMGKLGNPRIFTAPLTKGIILKRQEDFPNQPRLDITDVRDGSKIELGPFRIEFFRMNHNIPDNLGLFIETPVGNVLLLMSDSTGAEQEGHSLSEKEIQKNLGKIFIDARGRIITATFSSLINRIQQIITLSEQYNRKVAVMGFSMKNNIELCRNLGYIKANRGTIISSKDIKKLPDEQVTLLCTGAQGEGSAALMKIANQEHPHFRFKKGDSVIFSSSVIPGNERTVQMLKDDILRQGVKVYHYKMMDIHAGGHAQQEELIQLFQMLKPKFFMPIHGQYSMMVSNAELIRSTGVPEQNIVIAENGQIINVSQQRILIEKKTIPCSSVMVDGLGVGDVGEIVLRDRHMLARDGMFVIVAVVDKQTKKVKGSPDIISRGFVYLREAKPLLTETRKRTIKIINETIASNKNVSGKNGSGKAKNWAYTKDEVRSNIGEFLFKETQRRPIVLPVIIEA